MRSYRNFTNIVETIDNTTFDLLNQEIDALFNDLKAKIKDVTKPRSGWLNGIKNWLGNKSQKESVTLHEYYSYNNFLSDFQTELNETIKDDLENLINNYKDRFKQLITGFIKPSMPSMKPAANTNAWPSSMTNARSNKPIESPKSFVKPNLDTDAMLKPYGLNAKNNNIEPPVTKSYPKINYDTDAMRQAYGLKPKNNNIEPPVEKPILEPEVPIDQSAWDKYSDFSNKLGTKSWVDKYKKEKEKPVEETPPIAAPTVAQEPVREPIRQSIPEPTSNTPEPITSAPNAPEPASTPEVVKKKRGRPKKLTPGATNSTTNPEESKKAENDLIKLGMGLEASSEHPEDYASIIEDEHLPEDAEERKRYIKLAKEYKKTKTNSAPSVNQPESTPTPVAPATTDINQKITSFLDSNKGQKLLSMPQSEFKTLFSGKDKEWLKRNYSWTDWSSQAMRAQVLKQYIKKHPDEFFSSGTNESIVDIINKYKNWLKQTNKTLMD